jgi:hypothetical protein
MRIATLNDIAALSISMNVTKRGLFLIVLTLATACKQNGKSEDEESRGGSGRRHGLRGGKCRAL